MTRRRSPSGTTASVAVELLVEGREVGLGGRHAAVDGRPVGAGGHERIAQRRQGLGDAGRVEPDVRVVAVVVVAVVVVVGAVLVALLVVGAERVDVVADGEHRDAAVGDGVERVGQRLFQPEPVGDDERGAVEDLPVAQRGLERVGVAAGGDDRADVEAAVAGDAAGDVGPDAGRGDDVAAVGRRAAVGRAGAGGGVVGTAAAPGDRQQHAGDRRRQPRPPDGSENHS